MTYDELQGAARALAEHSGNRDHRVALVLGSGFGEYAAHLPDAIRIPFSEIPGLPVPKVEGHAAAAFSAVVDGHAVLVMAGRVHAYEGWPLDKVVFGVRLAVLCGCRIVVLTNAAGGVGDTLEPGDLVVIRDHLNLAARNPLVGPNDERFGPRFPDMSVVYSPQLRELARRAGVEAGVVLKDGVYAWFLGPSYETPAEVEMARRLGADLVGMSTVPEAIAARHMGAAVLGLSLVSNLAAGISPVPLSHAEVRQTAARAQGSLTALLDRLLPRMAAAGGEGAPLGWPHRNPEDQSA